MSYSLVDLIGIAVAIPLCGVLSMGPAAVVAHVADPLRCNGQAAAPWLRLVLILGCGLLPGLDALAARLFGMAPALIAHLAATALGIGLIVRHGRLAISGWAVMAAAVWALVVASACIDLDWAGSLHPSLLAVDTVKHAATVNGLIDGGAPPLDPFFLRDGHAGYYYGFYVLPAFAVEIAGGLIDARAAVAAQVFWTGLAALALARLVWDAAGLPAASSNDKGTAPEGLILFVACAAGLTVLPVGLLPGLLKGEWIGQLGWWNEQVTAWPLSVIWVPHHVAGFIACWIGMLLLAADPHGSAPRPVTIVFAGCAFAAAAGLSIWVAIGGAVTAAIWAGVLAWERRWPCFIALAAAGLVALVLASPLLFDMLTLRAAAAPAKSSIAFGVRGLWAFDRACAAGIGDGLVCELGRLALLPLNYALEAGAILVGSILFWREPRNGGKAPGPAAEVARLLTISAIASLVVGSFVKSTIANNDLGWRVLLFAQFAGVLWTASVLAPMWATASAAPRNLLTAMPRDLAITLAIGWCGVAYDLVALRAYPAMLTAPLFDKLAGAMADPVVAHQLRAAYEALDGKLGRDAVLQHNPDYLRTYAYGLYSRHRVAVSDWHNGELFGASEAQVRDRIADLAPVFAGTVDGATARARLLAAHVTAIVVTSADPLWSKRQSWLWRSPVLYDAAKVRVVPVATIEP